MASFIVETHDHGVLVHGSVPPSYMTAIFDIAAAHGFDYVDAGIAWALDAHWAFVSQESGAAWRAEIEGRIEREVSDPALRWLRGTDVGASAVALFFSMVADDSRSFEDARRALARVGGNSWYRGTWPVPYDDDDLGRCQRMVDRLGWHARLDHAAKVLPKVWKPWIERIRNKVP